MAEHSQEGVLSQVDFPVLRFSQGVVLSEDAPEQHVLRSFEEWEGWSTRGDWASLPGRIERARSVHEITRILGP